MQDLDTVHQLRQVMGIFSSFQKRITGLQMALYNLSSATMATTTMTMTTIAGSGSVNSPLMGLGSVFFVFA